MRRSYERERGCDNMYKKIACKLTCAEPARASCAHNGKALEACMRLCVHVCMCMCVCVFIDAQVKKKKKVCEKIYIVENKSGSYCMDGDT